MKKSKRNTLVGIFFVLVIAFIVIKFSNKILYNNSNIASQLATTSEDYGIMPLATEVPIYDFSQLKYYLELNDGNEYHLSLQNDIQVTQTVYCTGTKLIYLWDNTIINKITATSGPIASIYVNSGSALRLHSGTFYGRNYSGDASSNIAVYGTLNVYGTTFTNDIQGIHVPGGGVLNFYSGTIYGNQLGVGAVGTVNILGGEIRDNSSDGVHINSGSVSISGGKIYNNNLGVNIFSGGIGTISGGSINNNYNGVNMDGKTLTMTSGYIYNNTQDGIVTYTKSSTINFKGGNIYSNNRGIYSHGTVNMSGGNIYSNTYGIRNSGTLNISNGTFKTNTATNGSAIYQSGTCTITGGTFAADQNIYLATDDRYISTNTSSPTFVVKPNTYTRGRVLVKTSGESYAINELNYMTLYPNGIWNARAVGSNIVLWDKTNVIAQYVDTEGNALAESVTTTDWYGEAYETTPVAIEGYNLTATPDNATGTYAGEDITVTYVYETAESEIEIQYIDEVTKDVLETISLTGSLGDTYTSESREIDGYQLVTEPENKEITFEVDKKIVTYGYRKITAGVDVRYIDQETGLELIETEHIDGLEGIEYSTTAKEIEGYELVVTPDNLAGTYTVDKITVTYEYSLIKGTVTITKVDKNDESILLQGAVFKIEKLDDEGNIDQSFTVIEKTTDENGMVEFTELLTGKYRITEIKAAEGYELSGESIDIEISSENKEINIKATDRLKLVLPKTGSINYAVIILSIGISLMLISLCIRKNKVN